MNGNGNGDFSAAVNHFEPSRGYVDKCIEMEDAKSGCYWIKWRQHWIVEAKLESYWISQAKAGIGFRNDLEEEMKGRQVDLDYSARGFVGFDDGGYLAKQVFLESLRSTEPVLRRDPLAVVMPPQLAFCDVGWLIPKSDSARILYLGRQILGCVYDLNVESEREGRPALFKPTNKMYPACEIISTRVATDEASFGEIVDQLYFLLYEGSGYAARLRERCSNDQLAALQRLKDLRTGIRHDVDHGDNRSIKKKNREIGETYKSLIGMVIPRSRSDWTNAQLALYRQLVDMLEFVRREAPPLRGG